MLQLQEFWYIYSWLHIINIMKVRILFTVFVLLLISFDASAQCAMCRAVLETEEHQTAAKGINDGIVYLMAFPYLLMAGLGYFIWKSRRKNRVKE